MHYITLFYNEVVPILTQIIINQGVKVVQMPRIVVDKFLIIMAKPGPILVQKK